MTLPEEAPKQANTAKAQVINAPRLAGLKNPRHAKNRVTNNI